MKKSRKPLRTGLIGIGITIAIFVLMEWSGRTLHIEYYILPWLIYLIHWLVSSIIEPGKKEDVQKQ